MRKSLTSGWGIFFCTRIAPTSPQSPPQEEPPWVAPKGRLRRRGLAASATPPQKRWLVKNSLDLLFRFTLREISKWLTHLTSTQTRLSHPPGSLVVESGDGPSDCSKADTSPHAPPARRTAGFAESIQLAGGFARLGFSPRWWRRPARSQAATSACGGVRRSNQPNEPKTTVPKADQRVTLGGISPVPCDEATR